MADETGGSYSSGDGKGRFGQAKEKVQKQAKSMFSYRKYQASQELGTIVQILKKTGQQFREQNQENVAQYIDKAAGNLEQITNYLRDKSVEQIISETEDLARKQPALFLAGTFLAGFLIARVIKSAQQAS